MSGTALSKQNAAHREVVVHGGDLTPSQAALEQFGLDPRCTKEKTAMLLNAAVSYIHRIQRSAWTSDDCEIDRIEVKSRPDNVKSGWWNNA